MQEGLKRRRVTRAKRLRFAEQLVQGIFGIRPKTDGYRPPARDIIRGTGTAENMGDQL